LRYCIRRPANCVLLGRNESTPVELAGILEKMELEVDTTEEVAASAGIGSSTSSPATRKKQRKKQPSGVIRNRAEYKQTGSAWEEIVLDKSRRHPVRLPHGDCRLAWDESAGRFGEFGSKLMKASIALNSELYCAWQSYGRARHPGREEAHVHLHTVSSRSRGRLRASSTSIRLWEL